VRSKDAEIRKLRAEIQKLRKKPTQ
jgi:hypothetical protein